MPWLRVGRWERRLHLWTANGSGPIRVGDFTAAKFVEQVPAYVFARFLKVSAGYYVNPEGICTAEEDGPVLRLGLQGGGSILVPLSMARTIDSALQEARVHATGWRGNAAVRNDLHTQQRSITGGTIDGVAIGGNKAVSSLSVENLNAGTGITIARIGGSVGSTSFDGAGNFTTPAQLQAKNLMASYWVPVTSTDPTGTSCGPAGTLIISSALNGEFLQCSQASGSLLWTRLDSPAHPVTSSSGTMSLTPGANVTAKFLTQTTEGSNSPLPQTDARFTVNAIVSATLAPGAAIVAVNWGSNWTPNCQITPRQNGSSALAMVGSFVYNGAFYLVPLTGGLPSGTYTWDLGCSN